MKRCPAPLQVMVLQHLNPFHQVCRDVVVGNPIPVLNQVQAFDIVFIDWLAVVFYLPRGCHFYTWQAADYVADDTVGRLLEFTYMIIERVLSLPYRRGFDLYVGEQYVFRGKLK